MALYYYLKGFEHRHELSQFSKILRVLNTYYNNKSETAYLLGNPRINGCELDALLITSKFFVGIEFKNYGGDGYSVDVTENGWYLNDKTGKAVQDAGRDPLTVKGGAQKTPVDQAGINRRSLRDSWLSFKYKHRLTDDEKRRKEVETIGHISWFVVFNKELNITNRLGDNTGRWLKVVTNDTFIDSLDSKSKEFRGVFLSDVDIRKYLEEQGIRELADANQYVEPNMPNASPSSGSQRRQERNSTGNASPRWSGDVYGSGDGGSLSGLSKYYTKLAERGEMFFLALMSCIMAYMMMQRWWWSPQSKAMNIGAIVAVAIMVWFISVVLYAQHTRSVPQKGEMVDGFPRIKGLNKFSFFSVFICHLCWALLAGVIYRFLPLFLDSLLNDKFAFFGLLRIMCSLLQKCALVFGVWTIVSFVYRLYEMLSGTRDENSYFSRYCLSMMPFTRSDMTKDTITDYLGDFWKWIRALITMSALIPLLWVSITYFTDRAQFQDKFHYWPFKVEAAAQPATDSIPAGNAKKSQDKTQKKSKGKKSSLKETLPERPQVHHVDVERMYFDEGGGGWIKRGNTLQLHLRVEPADCDEEFTFEYPRDAYGNEIIRVDKNFLVTAVGGGESLIVVTSSRTKKQTQYLVHVEF